MNVIGCGRNNDKLKEMSEHVKDMETFVPVQCDIGKEDNVIEMFKVAKEMFNGIDVMINNAGQCRNELIFNNFFFHCCIK